MLNVNDIPEEYVRYIARLMSEFFEMVARGEKDIIDHANGYPDVYSSLREYVASHVDDSVDATFDAIAGSLNPDRGGGE